MPELKSIQRTYQSELQSLTVQLIPPDPLQPERAHKNPDQPFSHQQGQHPMPEKETVNRLIRRIKKI